jgi:hypothetical protein
MSSNNPPSRKTTLEVSEDLRDNLKRRKEDGGFKSYEAFLQSLLDEPPGRGRASGDEEAERERPAGERGGRVFDVRDALYSLEALSERPGMLEYLTGFDRSGVDLLIRRFNEVRVACVFFCPSTASLLVTAKPLT